MITSYFFARFERHPDRPATCCYPYDAARAGARIAALEAARADVRRQFDGGWLLTCFEEADEARRHVILGGGG